METELHLSKNLSIIHAYGKNFLGYNLKYLQKKAKELGYNLYDALIKRVDNQSNILDKIKGMESILDDLSTN